jgi:hypothetical protein
MGGAFGTHVENYKFSIQFFVGKPEGERPLALSRRWWKSEKWLKNKQEMGNNYRGDWINLTQDRDAAGISSELWRTR